MSVKGTSEALVCNDNFFGAMYFLTYFWGSRVGPNTKIALNFKVKQHQNLITPRLTVTHCYQVTPISYQ